MHLLSLPHTLGSRKVCMNIFSVHVPFLVSQGGHLILIVNARTSRLSTQGGTDSNNSHRAVSMNTKCLPLTYGIHLFFSMLAHMHAILTRLYSHTPHLISRAWGWGYTQGACNTVDFITVVLVKVLAIAYMNNYSDIHYFQIQCIQNGWIYQENIHLKCKVVAVSFCVQL